MRGSPVRKTSSGILRLVAKLLPGSVVRPRAARHLELELVGRRREHDEPALGAADLDRRIQHQRQHVVEHAAGAERAQALRAARQSAAGRRSRSWWPCSTGGGDVGEQEDHLGAAGAAEPDAVAVRQRALGDLLAVDVGAVAGVAVAEDELVVLRRRSRRDRARLRCRPGAGRWSRAGRSRTVPWRSARCAGRARRSLRGGRRAWRKSNGGSGDCNGAAAGTRITRRRIRTSSTASAAPTQRPAASCERVRDWPPSATPAPDRAPGAASDDHDHQRDSG